MLHHGYMSFSSQHSHTLLFVFLVVLFAFSTALCNWEMCNINRVVFLFYYYLCCCCYYYLKLLKLKKILLLKLSKQFMWTELVGSVYFIIWTESVLCCCWLMRVVYMPHSRIDSGFHQLNNVRPDDVLAQWCVHCDTELRSGCRLHSRCVGVWKSTRMLWKHICLPEYWSLKSSVTM